MIGDMRQNRLVWIGVEGTKEVQVGRKIGVVREAVGNPA